MSSVISDGVFSGLGDNMVERFAAMAELRRRLEANESITEAEKLFFQSHSFRLTTEELDKLDAASLQQVEMEWKARLEQWEKFLEDHRGRPESVIRDHSDFSQAPRNSNDLKEQAQKIQEEALKMLIGNSATYQTNRPRVQAIWQRCKKVIEETTRAGKTYENSTWVEKECRRRNAIDRESRKGREEERSFSYQARQKLHRVSQACKAEAKGAWNLVCHPTEIPGAVSRHPWRMTALVGGGALLGYVSPTAAAVSRLIKLGSIAIGTYSIFRRLGDGIVARVRS